MDDFLLAYLSFGTRGAVGTTYSLLAPLYQGIIKNFDSGNIEKARELQEIATKIIFAIFDSGKFFSASKNLLKEIGVNLGPVRAPNINMSKKEMNALLITLKKETKLFEFCSKN